jgi:hypothetical protein
MESGCIKCKQFNPLCCCCNERIVIKERSDYIKEHEEVKQMNLDQLAHWQKQAEFWKEQVEEQRKLGNLYRDLMYEWKEIAINKGYQEKLACY